MQFRRLGDSDLRVSSVALGCNNFGGTEVVAPNGTRYGYMDLEATRAVVAAALDAGINFFDTADVYGNGGSEQYLGAILRVRRHQASSRPSGAQASLRNPTSAGGLGPMCAPR